MLDIETKLIDVRAFGIRDQFLDLKQIRDIPTSARNIHCIGLKWVGQRKVTVLSEWEHGYDDMIRMARDALDQADGVVGFNHENFDMKKMNGQFALAGIDYPKPPTNIDIYKTVRKMGFASAKLDYIAQAFGLGHKVKHPGYEMWDKVLDGCPKAQKKMARYCAGDVRLTEDVYHRLRPYIENHPRLNGISGYSCNRCGSSDFTHEGYKYSIQFKTQRLKCKNCHGWRLGRREKIN